MIAANRATLRSGNPSLIFPGEIVALPAPTDAGRALAASWECWTARSPSSPARAAASARGHARLLAAEGARVVVNDLDADRGADRRVVAEIVDGAAATAPSPTPTTSRPGTAAARSSQQAVDEFGRLDIVVNNAGHPARRDELQHHRGRVGLGDRRCTSRATWRRATTRRSTGATRGKAGEEVSGRIINTASESGLYGQAGQINYSAAKAGIVSMTIVLAREMKKYGVTANVVCPRALHAHDRDRAGRGRVHAGSRVGAREHLADRRASSRATPPPTCRARCSSCGARGCT